MLSAVEQYKDSPKWPALGKAMAADTDRLWLYPEIRSSKRKMEASHSSCFRPRYALVARQDAPGATAPVSLHLIPHRGVLL